MSTLAVSASRLELAHDKDLPVTVWVSSEHGFDPTGLTVSAYLSATKGGNAITSPNTQVSLTEITATPDDRRQYRTTIDKAVVNDLITAGTAVRWLRVYDSTGALSEWFPIPVARDGYAVLT